MSALNFKADFEAPILAGTKILTMRKERIDHRDPAPVGKPLSLYTGMRQPSCRLILATTSIFRCGLWFDRDGPRSFRHLHRGDLCQQAVLIGNTLFVDGHQAALEALALADGFPDWAALWAFHSAEGPLENGSVYREVIGWEPPK